MKTTTARCKFYLILIYSFITPVIGVNFLNAQTAGPNFEWSKRLGDNLEDRMSSFQIDSHGNLYVCGLFSDTVDFDPDSSSTYFLTASPLFVNVFFAKYDSAGNFLWAKKLLSKYYNSYPYLMRLDKYDNIYLSGAFRDSTDFDPGIGTSLLITVEHSKPDLFFAKYDTNGDFIWAKSIYTKNSSDWTYNIEIDKESNYLYILGETSDTADFDPSSNNSNAVSIHGGYNWFIAKYDLNGNYKWVQFIEAGDLYIRAFKIDFSGNLIFSGEFYNYIFYQIGAIQHTIIGTSQYTTMGGSNIWDGRNSFFAKLDTAGNYVWMNSIKSGEENIPGSIAIDSLNNVLVMGEYYGYSELMTLGDSLIMPYMNNVKTYIVKFDSSGVILSANNFPANFTTMDSDKSGNVYMSGISRSSFDFDLGPGAVIFNPSLGASFLAKYDSDLNFLWAKNIGKGNLYGTFVWDAFPNIYFFGNFQGVINISSNQNPIYNLISEGNFDIFFAKFSIDSCSDFSVNVDSVKNILCGNIPGEAHSLTFGGIAPYSLSWNTSPISNTNAISTLIPRYYTITAVDSRGCMSSKDVHIAGPYQNDFDLKVNLVTTAFRPGTASAMWIDVFNNGCTPTAGSVMMILDSAVNFNSSNPGVNNFNGDTIIWNFGNLDYLTPHFQPLAIVGTSTLIAAPATELIFDLVVFPFNGDADTSNNRRRCHVFTFNSGDPNEKLVYPIGDGPLGKITNNQTMTYTVHFQNTGNAEAYNISILDTIDSDLDFQSLRVVGSSHPISSTHLLKDNLVRFNFNNINLPDSATDQLGSNGYVMYEIEQKANLTHLTQITNTAHIYFDFNPAIITNTVLNTIDLSTSVLEKKELENAVTIYPNPVTKSMSIILDKLDENSKVLIYDAQGKQIKLPFAISKNQIIVDTKDLKQGIYNALITFPKTGESRSCKFIRM